MNLSAFKRERYFAQYKFTAQYLVGASDCQSLSLGALLALEPDALDDLQKLWLGYTQSQGDPALRVQIAGLYKHIGPDQVLVLSGAEEAIFNFPNCHRFVSTAGVLLRPSALYDYGDRHFRIGFGRKNLNACVLQLEKSLEHRKSK